MSRPIGLLSSAIRLLRDNTPTVPSPVRMTQAGRSRSVMKRCSTSPVLVRWSKLACHRRSSPTAGHSTRCTARPIVASSMCDLSGQHVEPDARIAAEELDQLVVYRVKLAPRLDIEN